MGAVNDANELVMSGGKLAAKGAPIKIEPEFVPVAKRSVTITTQEHHVNDAAIQALGASPKVFVRGPQLVDVLRDRKASALSHQGNEDPAVIRPLPKAVLRHEMTACATWQRLRPKKETGELEEVPSHPPTWCVDAVHAMGDWPGLRPLRGIVESPVMREDGSIVMREGYDDASGLYVCTSLDVSVPAKPTRDDALSAIVELLDVVSDFPFADEASRSVMITAMLTPFARHAINGNVPLNFADASVKGSGKSLLADAVSIMASGREMPRSTYTADVEETRKALMAIAIEGSPMVLFDNVPKTVMFGDGVLDGALTSRTVSGRVLGLSKNATLPLTTIFFANGNNTVFGADTTRRTLRMRLEPKEERPEHRTGFKYPRLIDHLRTNRVRYVSAALTILRAFHVAGRPSFVGKPFGSFEAWSDLVRGAVMWCGLADPLDTQAALAEESDTDALNARSIINAIARMDRYGNGVYVRELIAACDRNGFEHDADLREVLERFAPPRSPTGLPTSNALGRILKGFKGVVADGKALTCCDDSKGFKVWSVRKVATDATDDSNVRNDPPRCRVSSDATDATDDVPSPREFRESIDPKYSMGVSSSAASAASETDDDAWSGERCAAEV